MPVGNETNHTMDGLTVIGGFQVGASGPYIAPGGVVDALSGGWRAGIETMHRLFAGNSQALTSQTIRFSMFNASVSMPAATIEFGTGTTAAAATPTVIQYGIYSVNAGGDLELLGATVSDLTLLTGINTRYPKALPSPVTIVGGQRYATAVLVVSATTMPNMPANVALTGGVQNVAPLMAATLAAQTSLPASVAVGSLTNTSVGIYAQIT